LNMDVHPCLLARKEEESKWTVVKDRWAHGLILSRVTQANRLILLLSGYDKGRRSSPRHQQQEIERARGYLKEWQAEQARQRRATPARSPRRRGRR
jgi:hypothetical protein